MGHTDAPPKRFVTFPGLEHDRTDEGVSIRNPVHGTGIEGSEDLLELLRAMEEPQSPQDLQALELEEADLAPFVQRHLIVDAAELPFLQRGLVNASRAPSIGEHAEWHDVFERGAAGDRVIFGAAVDIVAGGRGGARHGPREIRHAAPSWIRGALPEVVHLFDLERRYTPSERQVFDLGDVAYSAEEPYAVFGQRVSKLVEGVSAGGLFPILLGGDHSVSWFALKPLLDRHERVGVLHFDAHSDLYGEPGATLAHQNVFDFVCRHPSLAQLVQVGLRSSETPVPGAALVEDAPIRRVTARALRGMTPAQIFDGLPRDIPWYLSFDVDCLDPAIAPETGTTLVGGVGFYAALELFEFAVDHLNLVGADFVEVTDAAHRVNYAAHAVAEYLALCVLAGTPSSALGSHYYRHGP